MCAARATLTTLDPYLAARVGEHEGLETVIVSARAVKLLRKLIDEGSWLAGDVKFWLLLTRPERVAVVRWIVEEELV